ncbi:hypothetical protein KEC58_22415 (plasmid) [Photobacterium damselae]|uniref:hypothetical protein n=1 Tax=Photobacterium damselae TaxID=38293 RepID=UPI002543EEFA
MVNDSRLTWMDEEEQRADNNLQNGQTENTHAPVLKKVVKKAPERKTRGIYVQDDFWNDFEDLVLAQKKIGGKSKPELAEEALKLIVEKYLNITV